MEIRMADSKDKRKVIKYDNHIHHNKVGECIRNQLVYVLCDEEAIVGILRYSLFWQSIPFLDLLYIDEDYRGKGFGRQMMEHWESVMRRMKRGAWVPTDELVAKSICLAEEYKLLAEKLNISFIDTRHWNIELTFDGVHFTEAGHHALSAHLMEVIP